MKTNILKGVGFSFLSPLVIGICLGLFYSLTLENGTSATFFTMLLSAISNAHIAGIAIGVFVLPSYLYLVKRGKVTYSALLTTGLLGGAVSSYFLAATSGPAFIINSLMSALAGGLFLYGLRRSSKVVD
ncbi:hypothetical protein PALB_27250 [Pseudoalteromonas luteoviolacea B = ATCC 29581]|nr:hypothetical protein PALB_27250 [Pseudoalteromonas luteoviolacea B = ATCC 29581]